MVLHILELPKFKKAIEELTTLLDCWLYFLKYGDQLDPQTVHKSLDVPELRWAIGDLFMISQTDPEREIYEARLKRRRDAAAERQTMLDEGLEQGLAQGLAQGRAEGRAETLRTAIRALQKSLGHKVTPPDELQPLSLEDLERIWAELSNDG